MPSVRSQTSANAGAGTTSALSINKPAGAVVGDILYLQAGSNAATSVTYSCAGFTAVPGFAAQSQSNTCSQWLFYRIVDGTEGASFSVASSTAQRQVANMVCVKGLNTADWLVGLKEQLNAASTTVTYPSTPQTSQASYALLFVRTRNATAGNTVSTNSTGYSTFGDSCTTSTSFNQGFVQGDHALYNGGLNSSVAPGSNAVTPQSANQSVTVLLLRPSMPTIAANTTDGSSTSDTTPDLEFTGTDAEAADVSYKFELASANFPNSPATGFVQGAVGAGVATGTATSAGITTTVGNTIVVLASAANGTANRISTVADNKGNTYTRRISQTSSGIDVEVWESIGIATGGAGHTVTVTSAGAFDNVSVVVQEINGIIASGYDTSFGSSGVGTAVVAGAIAPATDNEIIIGAFGETSSASQTLGSGYSNLTTETSAAVLRTGMESKLMTPYNADQAASLTYGASVTWAGVTVAYKITPGVTPTISKLSSADAGFVNTVTGGDTDPFNSAEKARYTVQSALALGTWYWRARVLTPGGSNTLSVPTTPRSIILTASNINSGFFGLMRP